MALLNFGDHSHLGLLVEHHPFWQILFVEFGDASVGYRLSLYQVLALSLFALLPTKRAELKMLVDKDIYPDGKNNKILFLLLTQSRHQSYIRLGNMFDLILKNQKIIIGEAVKMNSAVFLRRKHCPSHSYFPLIAVGEEKSAYMLIAR